MFTRIYAITTILLLVGLAQASIVATTSITNAVPIVEAVTLYSNYSSVQTNTFIDGASNTVFIRINVSDQNGYDDVTNDGYVRMMIVFWDGVGEQEFLRFGSSYSLNATLEAGASTHAAFVTSFNMTPQDSVKRGSQSPRGWYKVKTVVSDGVSSATSNFTVDENAKYTWETIGCGDGLCSNGETCLSCAADCGSCPQTSTSGGGGGGGGGGSAGGITAPKLTYYWETINAGNIVSIKLGDSRTGLNEITFGTNAESSKVKFEISAYDNDRIPAGVIQTPAGSVYKYFETVHTGLADASFINVNIKFYVNRSWINANGLDENKIVLTRFTSGWNELPTTKLSSDANGATYEAYSPGMSIFAVVGKAKTAEREGAVSVLQDVLTKILQPALTPPGPKCSNDCERPGIQQCAGTTELRVCGNYDADSCLEWGGTKTCPVGDVCYDNACMPNPEPETATVDKESADDKIATTGHAASEALPAGGFPWQYVAIGIVLMLLVYLRIRANRRTLRG